MSEIVVPRQFRGPPFTANGGYICGVLSNAVGGRGVAMLRAGESIDELLSRADLALYAAKRAGRDQLKVA